MKISVTADVNNREKVIKVIIESCKSHPSILEISDRFSSSIINFMFQKTEISKVKKLLNETDIKKVVDIDTIPPKLIKV